jgi:hypothetical protein
MTKEEYEFWLDAEREKGPITHIIYWVSDDRNAPIIEHEEMTTEEGIIWKESKQYANNINSISFT